MKQFRSVLIDENAGTFKILDGTSGEYQLADIKECKILNEDHTFRGKSEPFVHQVLGKANLMSIFGEPAAYVGLKLVMQDSQVLAIYVSPKAVMFQCDAYNADFKEAQTIKKALIN